MSQESGGRVFSVGGEGVILIANLDEDMPDDAVNPCVIMWTGNLTVTEQDISSTCDYNPVTRMMNYRDLNTGQRLEGTFTVDHNSVAADDPLLLFLLGKNYKVRLYITQGNVAVVGPPAVAANRVCYFDLPEGKFGQIGVEGGEVGAVRRLTFAFKSQGVFHYVNEDAA